MCGCRWREVSPHRFGNGIMLVVLSARLVRIDVKLGALSARGSVRTSPLVGEEIASQLPEAPTHFFAPGGAAARSHRLSVRPWECYGIAHPRVATGERSPEEGRGKPWAD